MRVRRAEQREQGVAHELVDEAAELLHRGGEFFEQLVLKRLYDLGVEPFGEGRETAEVREQDCDGKLRPKPARQSPTLPVGFARKGRVVGAGAAGAGRNGSGEAAGDGGAAGRASNGWGVAPCFCPHFGQNAKSGGQA